MNSASTVSIDSGARPGVIGGAAGSGTERRVGLLVLCLLALIVGVMTGVGAAALRALIGLIHNGFYNGVLSFHYNANILEGPSRFGDLLFFSPIIGGLIVWPDFRQPIPDRQGDDGDQLERPSLLRASAGTTSRPTTAPSRG